MTYVFWYFVIGLFVTSLYCLWAAHRDPFWKATMSGFLVCTVLWPLAVYEFIKDHKR